ncbi:hypothetical protein [Streptomyces akebiae]|uniref:Uncharacterized protein n=1 Tax=Streptomyces akebiae TaxID=2865673 RepID=A0ABX8Y2F4_9ACTN|nr:hypothetical protein [Streptomyces akebiae]QYX81707.1 hypothetical protein K1J60_38700 [Streptomyces akebiae]
MHIDLTRAKAAGADFCQIFRDSTIVVTTGDSAVAEMLTEAKDLGYLNHHGAQSDEVGSYYVLQHHPYFFIVEKICTQDEGIQSEAAPRRRTARSRAAQRAVRPPVHCRDGAVQSHLGA